MPINTREIPRLFWSCTS